MALTAQALTTLESVKIYLGITDDTSQDAAIEQLINSVSADIANRCNREFGIASFIEKMPGSGRQKLLLNNYPIMKVVSVTADDIVLDVTDYDVVPAEGILLKSKGVWNAPGCHCTLAYGYGETPLEKFSDLDVPDTQNITVEYTAGYILPQNGTMETPATLPGDLEMACIKMIATDINRKGSEHEQAEALGPLNSTFLVNDYLQSVIDVLERYKKMVIV